MSPSADADRPTVNSAPQRQETVEVTLDGARVLIVEDDVIIAGVLADMLDALGCSVVGSAHQVERALALVREEAATLDAVLLDLRLGMELAYPVADALVAHGVPFGFMTGADLESAESRFATVPVLGKPFGLDELEALLHTVRARGRARTDQVP